MPWSPTQAFPHPLANILTRDTKPSVANFLSYVLTEILIWQGVGDLINEFRRFELGLDQLEGTGAPSLLHRLRVPFTYFWSVLYLGSCHVDVFIPCQQVPFATPQAG
jgi:hypothetical protein